MKTRTFIILTLSAMIVMSCSKEPLLDETSNEALEQKMQQQNIDGKKPKPHPFNITGFGSFELLKESQCKGLDHIEMNGQTTEAKLGTFKTKARKCTNFNDVNYIKGTHQTAAGDELYFYSEESGEDGSGQFNIIIYYGGTGLFKNASGKIKVYSAETFETSLSGTYKIGGKGTLTY
jgi:hypothetical protein